MSPPAMIALRDCADRVEAETIRIRLAAADIQAVITGTDHALALSLGGAPTNRLVRVEVAQADYAQAMELLAEDERRAATVGDWICSRCHEPNEAAFDLCWSCHKPRSDQDELATTDRFAEDPSESLAMGSLTSAPAESIEDGNPYRPVWVDPSIRMDQKVTEPLSDTLEDTATRALRAAAIGMLLFPPLLTCYSLYLLVGVPRSGYQHPRCRWRLLLAWGINLFMLPASLLWWMPMLG